MTCERKRNKKQNQKKKKKKTTEPSDFESSFEKDLGDKQ